MRSPIGAPGDGISRRQFLAATGAAGVAGAAGCVTTTKPSVSNVNVPARDSSQLGNLPKTCPPETTAAWQTAAARAR